MSQGIEFVIVKARPPSFRLDASASAVGPKALSYPVAKQNPGWYLSMPIWATISKVRAMGVGLRSIKTRYAPVESLEHFRVTIDVSDLALKRTSSAGFKRSHEIWQRRTPFPARWSYPPSEFLSQALYAVLTFGAGRFPFDNKDLDPCLQE